MIGIEKGENGPVGDRIPHFCDDSEGTRRRQDRCPIWDVVGNIVGDVSEKLLLVGKEELIFEEVPQGQHSPSRHFGVPFAFVDQRSEGHLGDGPVQEEVNDDVAVVGDPDHLLVVEPIDDSSHRLMTGHISVLQKRVEDRGDSLRVGEIGLVGKRQVACRHEVHHAGAFLGKIVCCSGGSPCCQESDTDDGGRSDGGHAPNAIHHLECELLESDRHLLAFVDRTHRRRDRYGLAQSDVDVAVAPTERADGPEHPSDGLLLFTAPLGFPGVVGHVLDLVISDRNRDQLHVVGFPAPQ